MSFFKRKVLPFNSKSKHKKTVWNWRKIGKVIIGETIYRTFVRIYFFSVFLGALLLYAPFSLNEGWSYHGTYWEFNPTTPNNSGTTKETYNFFDALFFSFSAFSNTGLVTKTTGTVFSIWGQIILLLLIQLGGFGLLASIVLLWQMLIKRKKLTFSQHRLLHFERGNDKIGESYKVIYFAFLVFLIIQLIGWILLSFFFYFVKPDNYTDPGKTNIYDANSSYHNWKLAIWSGLFHVISATNNAGFDILGDKSIEPYHTGIGNILSVIILICLILGGIGYPVFYDLHCWRKAKKYKSVHHVSLFTKLSLTSYLIIGILGAILILALELSQPNNILTNAKSNNWSTADKIWSLIFLSFSARSAGFASLSIQDLTIESQWLISVLMFIGASPASTGGGIRTTTLILIVLYLYNYAFGKKEVSIFKRTIKPKLVTESFVIFFLALVLVLIVGFTLSLSLDHSNKSKTFITFFEAVSAFGTSGLSNGATKVSGYLGKIGLIFLMFVGQLGISGTLLSFKKRTTPGFNYRYKYEDFKAS